MNSAGRHKLGYLSRIADAEKKRKKGRKKNPRFSLNDSNCTNLLERNHLETHHKAASAVITQEPTSITVPEAERCAPYTGIPAISLCLNM